MRKLGIYIHIPFCVKRCLYCGFYSNAGLSASDRDSYVLRLIREIRDYGGRYGKQSPEPRRVDTVFLGGGTPSILPAGDTRRILEAVREAFDVTADAEITTESNPGTLDAEKLDAYLEAGVNRLSIGIQSLDPDILRELGRIHGPEAAVAAVREAREAGFRNINTDLMFALPNQTLEVWMDTLDRILDLEPEHLSFYGLQIEEGTPFYEDYRRGKFDLPPAEAEAAMYRAACRELKKRGYLHYEISNAAKPGFECRHNLKYWDFSEYLGIGASASSFMDGVRFTEAETIANDSGALMEKHENTLADSAGEFVFTALRTRKGVSYEKFYDTFGVSFRDYFADREAACREYQKKGLLVMDRDGLRLTAEGIGVSNEIMAEFVGGPDEE